MSIRLRYEASPGPLERMLAEVLAAEPESEAPPPDFGDAVRIEPGEVPVFWACGVTPQAAVMASGVPFAITHAPGHMFITDIPDSAYHA